jgi:hypothetical protein
MPKDLQNILEDLFEYLHETCAVLWCDGKFTLTEKWIAENGHEDIRDDILEYLQNNGAYCDCEVLYNVVGEGEDDDDDDEEDDEEWE